MLPSFQDIPASVLNITVVMVPRNGSGGLSPFVDHSPYSTDPLNLDPYGGDPFECNDANFEMQYFVVAGCTPLTYPDIFFYDQEILITVNFSVLPNVVTDPRVTPQVGVYPGVTNSSVDILATTNPVYLGPGSHLYGFARISLEDRISNRGTAALGILQVSHGHQW